MHVPCRVSINPFRSWSSSHFCRSKTSAPIIGCVTSALMNCQLGDDEGGWGGGWREHNIDKPYMLMVELFSACKVRSALCERSALVAGKILISKPVSTRKYVFETRYLTPNFHANVLISSHFAYPSKWRPKL